jgi:hypothetical protein
MGGRELDRLSEGIRRGESHQVAGETLSRALLIVGIMCMALAVRTGYRCVEAYASNPVCDVAAVTYLLLWPIGVAFGSIAAGLFMRRAGRKRRHSN